MRTNTTSCSNTTTIWQFLHFEEYIFDLKYDPLFLAENRKRAQLECRTQHNGTSVHSVHSTVLYLSRLLHSVSVHITICFCPSVHTLHGTHPHSDIHPRSLPHHQSRSLSTEWTLTTMHLRSHCLSLNTLSLRPPRRPHLPMISLCHQRASTRPTLSLCHHHNRLPAPIPLQRTWCLSPL